MSKQKSKPRMWSYAQWWDVSRLQEFNDHHHTNFNTWVEVFPQIYAKSSEDEIYQDYVRWYKVHYSKLGQALR